MLVHMMQVKAQALAACWLAKRFAARDEIAARSGTWSTSRPCASTLTMP
jgi:hypothetical protein